MKKNKLLLAIGLTVTSPLALADVVLSEVLYDAPNNDTTEEYVELFNASCNAINLNDYKLQDNGVTYQLSGTIEPSSYFVVARNANGYQGLFNQSPNLSNLSLSLGNSGDYVKLLKNNNTIDTVAWEGGLSGWSISTRNKSIHRTSLSAGNGAWAVSSNAGSHLSGSLTYNCAPVVDDSKLKNNQAKTGLSVTRGNTLNFTIDVPANASKLDVSIAGNNGDADLIVSLNNNELCKPYLHGSNEQCELSNPTAGTYSVDVDAYTSFSNVSLLAKVTAPVTTPPPPPPSGDYNYDVYYQSAIGKSGATLKSALNALAKDHVRFSYSQAWDGLGYADEDPNNTNNVILLYTGRSAPKTNRAGMSNSQDAWNREHVWAKSHGFPSSGQHAYTDFHHLRPADVSVNSARGNKDFLNGGSEIGEAPGNFTDSDSFKAADTVKGDVARMIFYMDVRYEGNDNSGTPDLSIANGTTRTGVAQLGDLCTLLQWHLDDPVSNWERRRNSRIFEWQKNRNPFIDNPQWATELYQSQCP
ncbi:endonuclease [Psychrobium sp. nBUS_13]|uniref:endonuclease n=1 Tax=Psychrobium sp. nBUS_13 TaxID=3395319 RepID=UPI003EBEA783